MSDASDNMQQTANRPIPFSARYQRRGPARLMSLNLTPMIDVVFLLLFFFLTVSRFRGTEGMLPAQLPAEAPAVSTEIPRMPIQIRFLTSAATPSICRVTVDPFEDIVAVPIEQLALTLNEIRQSRPGFDADTPVHLLAGDDVQWDHVVNAYNAALAARYEKVFFARPPQ